MGGMDVGSSIQRLLGYMGGVLYAALVLQQVATMTMRTMMGTLLLPHLCHPGLGCSLNQHQHQYQYQQTSATAWPAVAAAAPRQLQSQSHCQKVFVQYYPSPFEQEWAEKVSSWQHKLCHVIKKKMHQPERFLAWLHHADLVAQERNAGMLAGNIETTHLRLHRHRHGKHSSSMHQLGDVAGAGNARVDSNPPSSLPPHNCSARHAVEDDDHSGVFSRLLFR